MGQLTKWRPTLTMIILLMMGAVLLLPVAGIGFFRLFENHLVKSTESELIAQSAAIAAVMAQKLREADTAVPLSSHIEADPALAKDKRWNPIVAQIDLSSAPILGERGAARSASTPSCWKPKNPRWPDFACWTSTEPSLPERVMWADPLRICRK